MREENHSNNSHNWNPAEAKPKNGSSSHISEFPMSLQPAFSSPVCLLPDISSIMKQSKAENATEVDALLYLIKVCWITMKQNDTNLKVRASKNQRDFPCLPNTCSHKVKDEFMFPKHFLFYEGDCEQMHTEVWLKKKSLLFLDCICKNIFKTVSWTEEKSPLSEIQERLKQEYASSLGISLWGKGETCGRKFRGNQQE